MPELTVSQLAALDGRSYTGEVKARLRDDDSWIVLLDPVLVERTRYTLNRMIGSIDSQVTRVTEEEEPDPKWLGSITTLRGYVKARLDAMAPPELPPVASSKEARAWRAFSAQLAEALGEVHPRALDALRTPYGGLTARQWLDAREEKKELAR